MTEYVSQVANHIKREAQKVIAGQEAVIDQILICLFAEGHALIEGVPGTAKTLMVKTIARIVGAEFNRIQFTPDLMPSDITGTNIFNMATSRFSLRQGPIFTDILLADEINRTPPKTQAALLEAMEERQVTIDGESHQLSDMFLVLATENPIEYEGTYPLPEAQLDRFLFKILINYPTLDEELLVIANWQAGFNSRRLDAVNLDIFKEPGVINRCREEVRSVNVEPSVQAYLVNLVRRTREHPALLWGASPRASVALLLAGKSLAAMRGRDFVTPDDVRDVVHPSLRHRVLLKSEAEIEGVTPDSVLEEIISVVEVPR
ncbi:MAG: MoxR family ATPase [Acidobacteria bacterium]|nr:MoxR family ATPase [Acidobacteriota bacterium]MBK9706584.1 MoxR family ATPase [Acidobacteriota bacterium]